MSLACRSLNDFGLLFSQTRAYEQIAITLDFPLQHFFLSPDSFEHIESKCGGTS